MKRKIIYLGFILSCLHIFFFIIYLGGLSFVLTKGYYFDYCLDKNSYGAPYLENLLHINRDMALVLNYIISYLHIITISIIFCLIIISLITNKPINKTIINFNIAFISSITLIILDIILYVT